MIHYLHEKRGDKEVAFKKAEQWEGSMVKIDVIKRRSKLRQFIKMCPKIIFNMKEGFGKHGQKRKRKRKN